jgi:hypothetical protein
MTTQILVVVGADIDFDVLTGKDFLYAPFVPTSNIPKGYRYQIAAVLVRMRRTLMRCLSVVKSGNQQRDKRMQSKMLKGDVVMGMPSPKG